MSNACLGPLYEHNANNFFDLKNDIKKIIPLQFALADFNRAAIPLRQPTSEPQHPIVVATACSRIHLSDVQNERILGRIFKSASPGASLSDRDIATLNYAFTELNKPAPPPLLEVVVHRCTLGGVCRIAEINPDAYGPNGDSAAHHHSLLTQQQAIVEHGLRLVELPNEGHIDIGDKKHARSRMLKIFSKSSVIRELVHSGAVIAGEAFFNEESREVTWMSFWTSPQAHALDERAFRTVINDPLNTMLDELHPGLASLRMLVWENYVFKIKAEIKSDTKVVMMACADSRVSPVLIDAPYGYTECIHVAGNAEPPIAALRYTLEDAVTTLKPNEQIILLMLSHSRCGAIGETLKAMCKGSSAELDDHPAGALVQNLIPRFTDYIRENPNPFEQDEFLLTAAKENAIKASEEIVCVPGPHGDAIRKMVRDKKVAVVPAVYGLTSGYIRMGAPLELL